MNFVPQGHGQYYQQILKLCYHYITRHMYVWCILFFFKEYFCSSHFLNNILHSFELNIPCLKVPSRFFNTSDENFKNSYKNKISACQRCWNPPNFLCFNRERLWRHKGIATQWFTGRVRYLETEYERLARHLAFIRVISVLYPPFSEASMTVRFASESFDLANECVDFVNKLVLLFWKFHVRFALTPFFFILSVAHNVSFYNKKILNLNFNQYWRICFLNFYLMMHFTITSI